jgi:hypothetical protein
MRVAAEVCLGGTCQPPAISTGGSSAPAVICMSCPDSFGGMACVDLQSDPLNCGTCLHRCPLGANCTNGVCACPAGNPDICHVDLPGTFGGGGYSGPGCVNLQNDLRNCGTCGNHCFDVQSCANGTCVCPAGQALCYVGVPNVGDELKCVDIQSNPNHCGGCAQRCSTNQIPNLPCVNGQCVCSNNLTFCSSDVFTECVDLQTSKGSCGACFNACPAVSTCVNGSCTCPSGTPDLCGSHCVDRQTDPNNCGACGHVCPAGQSCSKGACACPSGQTYCPGAGCVDLNSNRANCGACGHSCGRSAIIAFEVCTGGKCGPPPAA